MRMIFSSLLIFLPIIACDRYADRLTKDLLSNYNSFERPLMNASDRVIVDFGVALHQLVGLDEKSQTIETILFFRFSWVDVNLDWEPEEYGGIRELNMPISRIWRPDILLYNSADTPWDRTYPVPAVVFYNGTVRWWPPGYVKSSCKVDVTYFPFDDQECKLKYSSWTYDYYKLDLRNVSSVVDTSFYMESGDWTLIDTKVLRTVAKYDCCPNPYVDVTFYIHLRRRTLPYGANLIMPTLITSLMAILAFALPTESGEKVALDISVLLSLLFCLQMLADRSPPTSESIPLLGLFFLCCTVLVALSVVVSVIVLNQHHSDPDTVEMNGMEKFILLTFLPKLVRVSRPAIDSRRFPVDESKDPDVPAKKKPSIKRRTISKTTTCEECNVLLTSPCTCNTMIELSRSRESIPRTRKLEGEKKKNNVDLPSRGLLSKFTAGPGPVHSDPTRRSSMFFEKGGNSKYGSVPKTATGIEQPLRTITDCVKKGAKDEMLKNDWQFAAMAIDRLCLYLFFGLILLISLAFYNYSPHIVA